MDVRRFLPPFLFAFASLFAGTTASAQEPQEKLGEKTSIVEHITADSVNVIIMPDELFELLKYEKVSDDRERKGNIGYRVQVFSDNNARTAKNEARSKSRNIGARFPQYRTYVMYTSPYWRLRVGDFTSETEAEAAAADLRRAFPAYSREIRVVRDRINLNNLK